MRTPKFKIGDRVKYSASEAPPAIGAVIAVRVDAAYGYQYRIGGGVGVWWHESHLLLDVPNEPQFKVGDRVKGIDADGTVIRGVIVDDWKGGVWLVRERPDASARAWYNMNMSLDVQEPKKYATDLESRLGAEIIKQHMAITNLSDRLTEEIGGRHRERIAKEAAQEKLAASDVVADCQQKELWIAQQSLVVERAAKESAQKDLAEAQVAQRSVNDAYAAAVGKLYEAQKRNSKLMAKLDDITRIAGTP